MSSKSRVPDPNAKEIPSVIVDPRKKRTYEKGKFLGKGGFAKCYELRDVDTGEIMAGKIVPKSLLVKSHQRDKMAQEITLHKTLAHQFVVKLFSYFEDDNFVYIILELCRRRSLMELHKRRQAITEPETRYFMHQILKGVEYLHDNKIIHRDLKLGNIFLNDNMEVKLGDFGLATKVDFEGERKRTLCGTPNYIAPEVLNKKGHSYEVDIWSIGCILFTLLVGKPPFETSTLKETYTRIKRNEYHVPSKLSPQAKNLICKLLQHEPSKRPNVHAILRDEFMTCQPVIGRLPTSCLTTAPRFEQKNTNLVSMGSLRGPLSEINKESPGKIRSGALTLGNHQTKKPGSGDPGNDSPDCHLGDLHAQLKKLVESKPATKTQVQEDEAEDPKSLPMIWISKWVDYSDKYGFGYALSDESIGVLFNDITKLLLLADGNNIHYIDFEGHEHYYALNNFPSTLEKKVKLLNYFRNYMKEHLLKAGSNIEMREGDELSRIPSLKTWFRTSRAVVMQMTNGTVQINFFKDHTKIILCPLMGAVTYIDEMRQHRTFRFDLIEKFGCNQELSSRLTYALEKITSMVNAPVTSKPAAPTMTR